MTSEMGAASRPTLRSTRVFRDQASFRRQRLFRPSTDARARWSPPATIWYEPHASVCLATALRSPTLVTEYVSELPGTATRRCRASRDRSSKSFTSAPPP